MTLSTTAASRGTSRPAPSTATAARSGRGAGVWVLLAFLLVVAAVLSVSCGSRPIDAATTWRVVPHVFFGDPGAVPGVAPLDGAVVESRVWRTAAGILTGAALAVAGALLQGATRNPLGDPGILGLTAGAALAVVAGGAFFGLSGVTHQLWLAALGSAVAMAAVYALASAARGGARPVTLALTGAAVSAGLTALTSAVLLSHQATFDSFRRWQVGELSRPDGTFLVLATPGILVGLALGCSLARSLDALSLGDELGRGLGTHPALTRSLAGLAVVLLAGTSTALVGPLVFCGLLVPHAMRVFLGVSYRRVLPACVLAGPVIVLVADVLARVLVPDREIQVGIALVVIGAPALVAVLRGKAVAS
ncbi:iron ABC transporter permease [Kocuria sp.]|uniref:FecCD family ABC transporter permease n=1 Tax=Kocuria sp. TaxID=1871328 RepID=UPI0026DAA204|nr:iron ABC transporter permease [Kocuria sp.]MDO4918444.1 iron ABC transporter permease [Kocuria sp.]